MAIKTLRIYNQIRSNPKWSGINRAQAWILATTIVALGGEPLNEVAA